jgi:hypothetical protein
MSAAVAMRGSPALADMAESMAGRGIAHEVMQ